MSELKRLKETFDDKMGDAKKWIADPNAPPGGEGEKRARECAQVAQELGKASGAAGYDLSRAAQVNNNSIRTYRELIGKVRRSLVIGVFRISVVKQKNSQD